MKREKKRMLLRKMAKEERKEVEEESDEEGEDEDDDDEEYELVGDESYGETSSKGIIIMAHARLKRLVIKYSKLASGPSLEPVEETNLPADSSDIIFCFLNDLGNLSAFGSRE